MNILENFEASKILLFILQHIGQPLYPRQTYFYLLIVQDPFVTRIRRDQKISRIEFVANTGGLLGLCTGFSFVTFCEIIYQVNPWKDVKSINSLQGVEMDPSVYSSTNKKSYLPENFQS